MLQIGFFSLCPLFMKIHRIWIFTHQHYVLSCLRQSKHFEKKASELFNTISLNVIFSICMDIKYFKHCTFFHFVIILLVSIAKKANRWGLLMSFCRLCCGGRLYGPVSLAFRICIKPPMSCHLCSFGFALITHSVTSIGLEEWYFTTWKYKNFKAKPWASKTNILYCIAGNIAFGFLSKNPWLMTAFTEIVRNAKSQLIKTQWECSELLQCYLSI